jgi:glycosyltransferase 2 family protein
MSGRSRVLAVQVAVSAAALVAVVWWATRQSLPAFPSAGVALPRLALAIGIYALASALRGERWWRLLRHGGVESTRADAYALTTVGYMGNNALPARAGDLMKAFMSAGRAGAPRTDLLGMLVAERLLDAGALALLFAGLVTTLHLPVGQAKTALMVGVPVLLALAAVAIVLGRRTERGRRARATIVRLLAPTRRLWGRQGAGLLATSVVVWLLEGSIYAILGSVAGVHLSLLDGLYIMALANLVAMIPAAPGYVGTFDAAVIFAVQLVAGGPHSAALAYVVLVRFVLFVPITVVGLVALVARYGGLRGLSALRARPIAMP